MSVEIDTLPLNGREIQLLTECLTADVVREALDRLTEFPIPLNGDGDPLGDLEILLLAHVLDTADKLAGQTLADQFGGQGRLESDHEVPLGGNDQSGLGGSADNDIRRIQGNRLAVNPDRDRLAGRQGGDFRGGKGGNGSRDLLHPGTELGTESLEIGLERDLGQGRLIAPVSNGLDVELIGDQLIGPLQAGQDPGDRGDHMDLGQGLADLEVVLHTELAPQLDHALDQGHPGLQGCIAGRGIGSRIVAEMDGFGHGGTAEIAVDRLADKGREGGRDLAELDQHVAQGPIGMDLVPVILGLPETAAAPADIPVGQGLDKGDKGTDRTLEVILVHGLGHIVDQRLQGADNPAVKLVVALRADHLVLVETVDIGVGDEETVGVPPGNEEVAEDLLDPVLGEAEVLGADNRGVDQVESQGICPVGVQDPGRIRVVLQAFGHLLAVLRQNQAVNHHIPVGGLAEETGSQDHQGVEPAAGLVKPLCDEIGREETLDLILLLKGIVLLGVGHGPRLEPAVQDLRRTAVGLPVPLDQDLVDEVLMEIGNLLSGEFLQFGNGTDADHVLRILLVDPDRDTGAPEAVAADIPVTGILDPVPESFVADIPRHPVHRVVVGGQTVVEILDLDVPGIDRTVDQRGIGPVAEGVGVDDGRLVDQLALGLQTLDNILIAGFAEAAFVLGDRRGEVAGGVEGIGDRQHAGLPADPEVVLTVGRCDMDQAGTVLGGDIVVVQDMEGTLGPKLFKVGEDRLVAPPLDLAPLEGGDQGILVLLLVVGGETLAGDHEVDPILPVPDHTVVDIGTGTDHQVFGEGPRCGGPDQQIGIAPGGISPLEDLGPDRDGRILDILVVAPGLEVGERGAQLPAVGHDTVRFVDTPLLPKLLENPPDGLHELRVHGLVVVVEVDPPPHPGDGTSPLVHVLQHHGAALLIKGIDTELFDLVRTADTQRILGQGLDRKTMAIPAETALDMVAAHGLVTGNNILDRPGQEVAVVGKTGRERRPIIKDEIASPAVLLQTLFKGSVLFPKGQDILVHFWEICFIRYRLKHADSLCLSAK